MKTIIALSFSLIAIVAVAGFDLEISLWKGESFSEIVPDECPEINTGAIGGVSVERGTLLSVRYNELISPRQNGVKSLEYRQVADRAVYGSKAPGIHFVTVTAAADAKAGVYDFGQLKVTVVDRTLPPAKDWEYFLDLWQHPWAVARVNGLAPFSEAHYRAMEPLWKLLASAGQKTLTVTLLDTPWNHQCYDAYRSMIKRTKTADGKWQFDYSVFDKYVQFGRMCGLGPQICCYTMCPWEYMADWIDAEGKVVRMKLKPGMPEFDEYWCDFLIDFSKHLSAKGWLNDTYISMDERSPEDLAYIAKLVRRVSPGLKIAMAGNRKPSEFKGIDIDNYSQAMRHVDRPFLDEVPARRKAGKITTYYICCSPKRPNTFMFSGFAEAFVCGFYPAACNLDGLLRWAYNSWGEDSLNDMTFTRWGAGDIALVYPDGSPSWRFLDLKNGIQQAEKFNILKKEGKCDAKLKELVAKFDLSALLKGTDYPALRRATLNVLNK